MTRISVSRGDPTPWLLEPDNPAIRYRAPRYLDEEIRPPPADFGRASEPNTWVTLDALCTLKSLHRDNRPAASQWVL